MIVIGVDPDSKSHGVAVYWDGKLSKCCCMTTLDIYFMIEEWLKHSDVERDDIKVSIEDVCANNAIFRKGKNVNVQQSIARRLGMVQQAQVELERVFEYYCIKVVKHKISKMWKKDKSLFEKVTGWKGSSNQDSRSAAWFGFDE